jgi:iron complex outermembrane recepter protein
LDVPGPVAHCGARIDRRTDYRGASSFSPIGTLDYAVPGSDLPFGPIPDVPVQLVNEYRAAALYAQDQISIGERVHILAGLLWSKLGQTEVLGGVGNDLSKGRVDPRIGASIDVADGIALFGG